MDQLVGREAGGQGLSGVSMRKHLLGAVLSFIADALVLGSGIFVILLLAVALLEIKSKSVHRLRIVCLYAGTAFAIAIVNYVNLHIAEVRSGEIISACENYKVTVGKYPQDISELVPRYVPKIPLAKYTFYGSQFIYIGADNRHSLAYSAAGLGKRTYSFELHRWRTD